MNVLERMTIDPAVMSGKPLLCGLRVAAANVLRLPAAGYSHERTLAARP